MEPVIYKGTSQGFVERLTDRIGSVRYEDSPRGILVLGFKVPNHRYFHKVNTEITHALRAQGDFVDARIYNVHNDGTAYLVVKDRHLPQPKQIVEGVEESMPVRRRPVSASVTYWPQDCDPKKEASRMYSTLCERVEAAEERFPEAAPTLRYQHA